MLKEHIMKVHHILDRMHENNLFLKLEKCTFHKREINYLGLIIGNRKVTMDPIKIQGIPSGQCQPLSKVLEVFLDSATSTVPLSPNSQI